MSVMMLTSERNNLRPVMLPTNGGTQDVLCLSLDFVPLWLAKISVTPTMKENNPELVDKLIQYQLKAKDVLAQAFLPQYSSSDDELLARAFIVAQNKIAEKDNKIKQLEIEVIEMDKTIS